MDAGPARGPLQRDPRRGATATPNTRDPVTVILAGRWEFLDEEKFQGTKAELRTEIYLHVEDHGI